jgi:hypothetical protein
LARTLIEEDIKRQKMITDTGWKKKPLKTQNNRNLEKIQKKFDNI